uniref:Protein kinase domain-containing protein n=1 Tax=Pyrodinium bahamense TaxID=73915 RepID=A0A7S0A4S2_9DINO
MEAEVAVLRRVGTHPHCVTLHEDFLEGFLSYIVMERCDMTLPQALDSLPELTTRTLMRIIREMLLALDCIHGSLVVHRDIKPDNFLCSGEERTIKLCDFGLAALLPKHNGQLRGLFGTPPFMSPEIIRGDCYGTKTDVWSLGVLTYVLLCGQLPYQPLEKSAMAMKTAIVAGTPAPTSQPGSCLDTAGSQPSPAAILFLRSLLERNKVRRPAAADALQLKWLDFSADSQRSEQSLRPMFDAAKRTGAFGEIRASKCVKQSALDAALASMQAKHRGGSTYSVDTTEGTTPMEESANGSPISSDLGSWTSRQSGHHALVAHDDR